MSVDLKMYQGSKGEWIGSFHRQDMANLVPRLPHPQFGFQRQDLPNLPPCPHRFTIQASPPGLEVVRTLRVWTASEPT
jgi:hypothetical protein